MWTRATTRSFILKGDQEGEVVLNPTEDRTPEIVVVVPPGYTLTSVEADGSVYGVSPTIGPAETTIEISNPLTESSYQVLMSGTDSGGSSVESYGRIRIASAQTLLAGDSESLLIGSNQSLLIGTQ